MAADTQNQNLVILDVEEGKAEEKKNPFGNTSKNSSLVKEVWICDKR